MLKTFSIQTLGCRVNQYESDQLATLLRSRGLEQVDRGGDLRVVNTCSVTVQAASKSRQTVRRAVKLPVLRNTCEEPAQHLFTATPGNRSRVLVTGCWATSNPTDAANLPGVDAVLGHHDDISAELDRLLTLWTNQRRTNQPGTNQPGTKLRGKENQTPAEEQSNQTTNISTNAAAESFEDKGSIIQAGTPQRLAAENHTHDHPRMVKKKVVQNVVGTRKLPLLDERQSHHQRAYLKIQDGCDAHCTYCIIPQLRPTLSSKSVTDAVEEAQAMVDAGHREIVLTGIFMGAYGQPTALRRRQQIETAKPLADLVTALCTQVRNLHRLRFSSLEPGDLTPDLVARLKDHEQVVPHFHLPLQSGSEVLLHRMNRQYSRDDFLRMIDTVHKAFDRPAITTDIIVGFPGETDYEFAQTLDIVDRVKFIHTHAFSFSPRPGTAAARWTEDFVHGPIVNERIAILNDRARTHSFEFRKQFMGEQVEVLVERPHEQDDHHHGRCERYFDVQFPRLAPLLAAGVSPGDAINLRITEVTPDRTLGEILP